MANTEDIKINIRRMCYSDDGIDREIIKDLDMAVPARQFIAILGPSGCGKTTLLRIIAGLEKRFDGCVTMGLQAVRKPSRDIQIVFQDNRLLPWKTVSQNLHFAFAKDGKKPDSDFTNKLLRLVGLSSKSSSWPSTLSGGEQSRLALARIMACPPRVLLLDEPFRNLDIKMHSELRDELLNDYHKNKYSAILVSHTIEDAVYLADKVYVVTSSPMRLSLALPISLPRPRFPDANNFIEVYRQINEALWRTG